MDTVKNTAKAATSEDSQFKSGKIPVITKSLAAYVDTHNQATRYLSRAWTSQVSRVT